MMPSIIWSRVLSVKGLCAKNKSPALPSADTHHPGPEYAGVRLAWRFAFQSEIINIYCILSPDQSIRIKTLSPHSGAAADCDGAIPGMQTVNGGRHWTGKYYINVFCILKKTEQT